MRSLKNKVIFRLKDDQPEFFPVLKDAQAPANTGVSGMTSVPQNSALARTLCVHPTQRSSVWEECTMLLIYSDMLSLQPDYSVRECV